MIVSKFDSISIYNYNIIIDGLRFEWDENKNSTNKQKKATTRESKQYNDMR